MSGIPPIEPYSLPTREELPANTARWAPDAERAALLVHDMQRFFLAPLPADTLRGDLITNVARLRDHCAALDLPVAYTAQPGGMTPEQRGLLADFWGPGMSPEPEHRQIDDSLSPALGDRVFTKWRYSAFHQSGLLEWLREQGRDQLIICGVYAHVGVLMTAVDAFSHGIQPFLVADATADFSAAYHHSALQYAAERCAVVLTGADVRAALGRPGRRPVTAGGPARSGGAA
ncbi:isochorismatase family protein [Streptomyces johnsoniae]|uniref:Isochorismatase family protein n=1 Tax=Streptomyces johnsoniae TaxID=3075532 RepID=A0ABU2S0Z6_9ACTN|nr:isochorismatase family protein [Streptomyces sp. DSM 41886]MDT0441434.1 isochorismatase family protein [Streptomyces sp. DSM 41886]